jgi:HK97 gp10 family phage protein
MNKNLIEVKGFPELNAKLMKLANDKEKKRPILQVLRAVASGTAKVAKQEAPVSKKPHVIGGKRTKKTINPGNLKKSIGIINGKRGKAKENPTVYVGPRAKGNHDGFYGAWVEAGHIVKNKGGGRKRTKSSSGGGSRTKPNPFMRRAYNKTQGRVTPEVSEKVAKVIQRNIDKLSK